MGAQLGRGHELGDILGEMTQVAEGVRTTPVAVELGDLHGLEMPICRTTARRWHDSLYDTFEVAVDREATFDGFTIPAEERISP